MPNGKRKPVKPKGIFRGAYDWLAEQAEQPWFGIEPGRWPSWGPDWVRPGAGQREAYERAGEMLFGPGIMAPEISEWDSWGYGAQYPGPQYGQDVPPMQAMYPLTPETVDWLAATGQAPTAGGLRYAQPVPGEAMAAQREAAGQAQLGQAAAPAEIGARGAPMRPSARIPGMSSLATGAWQNAFVGVHGVTPEEFYTRWENRKPGMTWQQSADYDLAFADAIRRRNVRKGSGNVGPSHGEWIQWYYQSRGWRQPPESQMKAREGQMARETTKGWI